MSLGCVSSIITSRESLLNLQALIAMAVFAMNTCCFQIEEFLLAEACRSVLTLRYHKSSVLESDPVGCYRAFWVLYHMDKQYNFQARSSSVGKAPMLLDINKLTCQAISDLDVGCRIPSVPDSTIDGFNWFMSSIRIARIISIAYDSLFSVTASTKSPDSLLPSVNLVETMLEDWRQSIPPIFRPGETLQRSVLADPHTKEIAIRTQFYYFHLVIALQRMKVHLSSEKQKTDEYLRTLLNAARQIVDLTRFIDVEPYTPVFILTVMPLSALFILFDFIVQSPGHPGTRENLTLLDILSGHFSLLERVSDGTLPGNYLSHFARIARQHFEDFGNRNIQSSGHHSSTVAENLDLANLPAGDDPALSEHTELGDVSLFLANLDIGGFV
ncbi:unnamed protein product [Penicillium salamii]|uniref:Transcription factor domain-containing protein n=1 Tax=Penicillium salamii TaxID=1612424 RepID=A0A9W4NBX1_9EURO|nr:unnamed protein product [Penicillium salamii]